jgi:hypothetical protein
LRSNRKSALIGASLAAIIILGAGGETAAQSSDEKQSSAEMSQEIKALRDRVEALQRRLDAQIEAEQQAKAAADAAAAQAAAAQAAAATIPAQVQRAVDAASPKTDKIYYKGATITLGGFLAAEYLYRSRDTTNDISTAFNKDYFNNNPVANTPQTVFTARQSRISALVQGDPNPQTHLGFYTELDFQGAAQTSNSVESDSYVPRLRHLYGTVDWDDAHLHLLAGQAWSLVTLDRHGITPGTEVTPPTIDGQYMPGFTWARQPQLRLTQDIAKVFWVSLSLENPQTTFYTGANALPASDKLTYEQPGTGLGYNSANTLSLNHIPDVILKIAADPPYFGGQSIHVETYGLYSSYFERLDGENDNETGGGFGGGLIIPVVPHFLDFQVSGLAGKGIGRYGSGQLPEVTFDPAGTIQPIHEIIAMSGLTFHAGQRLDFYLFAGEDRESAQAYNLTTKTDGTSTVVPYGYGNAKYSNTGCWSETAIGACVGNERMVEQATTGFWNKPYIGKYGTLRWGLQYSRTEFKAFRGVGGSPIALDNMVFGSFRYYPFNN